MLALPGYRTNLFTIAALLSFTVGATDPVAEILTAPVRFVVDGDSLYLAGVKPQIRLWGVDAPERDEPGFNAARNALKQLVVKQNIHCRQQDIDKYGRIVARCRLAAQGVIISKQGASVDFSADRQRDINAQMIRGGTAREYCYFSKGYYGACPKK